MFSARNVKVPSNFKFPTNTSGRGHSLTVGFGVSVYYDLQPPNVWLEHAHPVAQIVIALDPVEAIMEWSESATGPQQETSSTPHVWVIPPNIPHSAEWKGSAAMIVLYVEPGYIREECQCDLLVGAVVPLSRFTQSDYLITRLCRKFHDICHRKRLFSETFVAAIGAVLAPLLLNTYLHPSLVRQSRARGLSEVRLRRVTDYIELHLREPLTRAVLARECHLTEHHFSRMFKASMGMAPMKYVWRCRIYRARQLLETGQWKVAAVAAETCFFDQSHLDRQFRKEFGCSPGSVVPLEGQT